MSANPRFGNRLQIVDACPNGYAQLVGIYDAAKTKFKSVRALAFFCPFDAIPA